MNRNKSTKLSPNVRAAPLQQPSRTGSRAQVVEMFGFPRKALPSFDEAFKAVLRDVLEKGAVVQVGSSLSIGSERVTRELLNYSFELGSARDRLLYNPDRPLNLTGALGRFVWMMSGSDRLSDIEYYEPKVKYFSDDGITVPGSNYGTRLFEARPGLNQITNIIRMLKDSPHTRRAAASIYHPEDTGRESKDIPCTFGLFYNVRNGILYSTTVMRSNNAWVLLPYNVFEFSLLAEIIAAEIGVEVGPYYHFASSMHVYDSDFAAASSVLATEVLETREHMPPVPHGRPWEGLRRLLQYEIALRTNFAGLNGTTFRRYLKEARELGGFWDQLGLILLIHGLRRVDRLDLCKKVLEEVQAPYRPFLDRYYGPLFEGS